jgi:hypothetical protein
VRCAQKHLANYAPTFVQKILLYAVSPQEPWRLRWDLLVLILVIYSSIIVPYDAAFRPDKAKTYLDTLVDFTFYADILLNFWTGFDKGYEIVLDKGEIVRNYLSTWFIVDFVATVEWSAVVSVFSADLGESIGVKMLALIKIFRLARASRLIDRLTANWTTHSGYIEAGKFFMYVAIVGHLLACFFFLWPVLMSGALDPEDGRLDRGYGECVEDSELSADVRDSLTGPDPDLGGTGWFYKNQCMQNSWRQGYGLEVIRLPMSCGLNCPNGECKTSCELEEPGACSATDMRELLPTGIDRVYGVPPGAEERADLFKNCDNRTHCMDTRGQPGREGAAVDEAASVNPRPSNRANHALRTVSDRLDDIRLAFRPNTHEFLEDFENVCPKGSEREDLEPVPLNQTQIETLLLRCLNTAEFELRKDVDPGYSFCPTDMRPIRLYIDALYWSLTTMTTIGYGDRGPSTESELVFVLFAEVFGLAFFALLLTQINNVSDVMGETSKQEKDIKDGVLQFLKNQGLDKELIADTVKFLNFRSSSFSGNAYSDDDPRFEHLSDGLKGKIREAVYMPVLKKIAFFGWDDRDDAEEASVKDMFDRTDTDNSGKLDKQEIKALFTNLELHLTDEQFDICFNELDRENSGEVEFHEFSWWWFLTKYGKPRISSGTKCPIQFLEQMCTFLQPKAFALGERLIGQNHYGEDFVILLSGKLRVLRPGVRPGLKGWHPDHNDRNESRDRFVLSTDREPMVGFASCLTKAQWDHVRNRTDYWAVDAEEYTDTLWINRKNILRCFKDSWAKGQADMVEVAYYHYEVELIQNGKTEMDDDASGIVDHDEFLRATPKLPAGFKQYKEEKDRKQTGGSQSMEGQLDMASLMAGEEASKETELDELMEEEDLIHEKVLDLEAKLSGVGGDISTIKKNMENLMTKLGISKDDNV